MKNLSLLLAIPFLLAPQLVAAQGQRPENLKYFPQDISRDSLIEHMHGFESALGVGCNFCHMAEAPAQPGGRERLNFPSDAKPQKRTARFMLRMTDSLNQVVLASLPDRQNPPVVIQCVTCHRGSPYPQTLQTVLTAAVNDFGADSAVARYERLREDMVSGRYDFSEASLTATAQALGQHGKVADAITLLELNQKYYPNSANIDFAIGDLYLQSGDRDKAIVRYRTVLQKRPNDRRAAQRLRQLGADGAAVPPGR